MYPMVPADEATRDAGLADKTSQPLLTVPSEPTAAVVKQLAPAPQPELVGGAAAVGAVAGQARLKKKKKPRKKPKKRPGQDSAPTTPVPSSRQPSSRQQQQVHEYLKKQGFQEKSQVRPLTSFLSLPIVLHHLLSRLHQPSIATLSAAQRTRIIAHVKRGVLQPEQWLFTLKNMQKTELHAAAAAAAPAASPTAALAAAAAVAPTAAVPPSAMLANEAGDASLAAAPISTTLTSPIVHPVAAPEEPVLLGVGRSRRQPTGDAGSAAVADTQPVPAALRAADTDDTDEATDGNSGGGHESLASPPLALQAVAVVVCAAAGCVAFGAMNEGCGGAGGEAMAGLCFK